MEEEKQEPPVLPVASGGDSGATEAGVKVRVDQDWQISHMPEEKQYFSQDVSGGLA